MKTVATKCPVSVCHPFSFFFWPRHDSLQRTSVTDCRTSPVCNSTHFPRPLLFLMPTQTVRLIKSRISHEVDQALSLATLFRTNSMATKMFRSFARMSGLHYIRTTLGYGTTDGGTERGGVYPWRHSGNGHLLGTIHVPLPFSFSLNPYLRFQPPAAAVQRSTLTLLNLPTPTLTSRRQVRLVPGVLRHNDIRCGCPHTLLPLFN